MAARGCKCPRGAKKRSTKGRGMGFVCMKPVTNAPRLVKAKPSGSCPRGAKKKRMGRSGMRCMKYGKGWRFVAPVGCASRSAKRKSRKRKRRR